MSGRDLSAGSLPILTFLAFFAAVLVPLWSITLALAPLPVYLAVKQRGPAAGGIMVAVIGAAAAALIGWAAAPAVIILLALGYLPGLAGPADKPGRRILAATVLLLAVFCAIAAAAYWLDRAQTAKIVAQETANVREQVMRQAGSPLDAAGLESELDKLILILPYIFFALLAVASVWLAWLNYAATGWLAARRGLDWTPLPEFSHWQLPWFWAYGFILGLVGALFSHYFGAYSLQAYGAGLSLLLVFGVVYFVQGLAIVKFFADRRGLSPVAKTAAIVVGVLVQLFFQGLSWLGLFDTWFDFRKLASPG